MACQEVHSMDEADGTVFTGHISSFYMNIGQDACARLLYSD